MTLSRLTAADSSISHRSSFSDNHKRKFDDYAADYGVDLLQKMKRHEFEADYLSASHQSSIPWRSGENSSQNWSLSSSVECSTSCSPSSVPESSNRSESTRLQIFVSIMSGGKTIVIHADKNDTVEKLHHRIQLKTKIPVKEQRVIYKGKQLQLEQSLSYYSIEQDSSLHLVGRMQSTEHPVAWQTVDNIMYTVFRMHRGEKLNGGLSINNINDKLVTFFAMMPAKSKESTAKYLKIFSNSSVPAALVMLFASPLEINKSCGKSSIKLFLNSCIGLPDNQQSCCLPVVLEFCRLLRRVCPHNKLYVSCRNTLGSMLESVNSSEDLRYSLLTIGDEIFPCLSELADLMVKQLVDDNSGPSLCDVEKFSSFWQPLRYAIQCQVGPLILIALPLRNTVLGAEIGKLYHIFGKLLTTMDNCMLRIESLLARRSRQH